MKLIKFLHSKEISLFLSLLICAIIFYFSNQSGSQSEKISNTLFIRKLGHLSEFFALGYFFSSFLATTKYFFTNKKKYIVYSLLFVVLYAISDEVHQLFIPNRSGNITDVFIDSIGGMLGIFTFTILKNFFKI
ncbi:MULTISPECIES: VanZ family protein [unclassified Gemella]|uniref:VanZ family protein n=1 Tax=unclassified Gemella TaxID=2624949 RepID=UPI001C059239|nr:MULTISPECIES: VanZ family protein [unclassified Gemella]MBU0279101.1 VanZ family protein [Gemella sp. zg-1178]QWQ39176.1 VanZ family protein [Gemella sp. zg-570]